MSLGMVGKACKPKGLLACEHGDHLGSIHTECIFKHGKAKNRSG